MASILAEGNAPKDGAILGCDMALRVVERARLISRRPKYHRSLELPLMYEACFDLEEGVGGIAVAVT